MLQTSFTLGDISGDYTVGIDDIIIAIEAFGLSPSSLRWNIQADMNGDGYVGIEDINMGRYHYVS